MTSHKIEKLNNLFGKRVIGVRNSGFFEFNNFTFAGWDDNMCMILVDGKWGKTHKKMKEESISVWIHRDNLKKDNWIDWIISEVKDSLCW